MVAGPNFAEKILTIEDVTPFPLSRSLVADLRVERKQTAKINACFAPVCRIFQFNPFFFPKGIQVTGTPEK
jgi:hypothetical protein